MSDIDVAELAKSCEQYDDIINSLLDEQPEATASQVAEHVWWESKQTADVHAVRTYAHICFVCPD